MKPDFSRPNSAKTISSHTATVIVLLCAATLAIAQDGTNAMPSKHTMTYQERVAAQTQAAVQAYFAFHHISPAQELREGMPLAEFVKILGEPSGRHTAISGLPEGGRVEEDWRTWSHDDSPFIMARVQNGVVTELKAGVPPEKRSQEERIAAETPGWLEAYFVFNHITPAPDFRVGMKLEEFIKVLGEPTRRYQRPKGRMVNGKPEEGYEDWVTWYHNPGNRHVAPIIRVRVENGIVTKLEANRA